MTNSDRYQFILEHNDSFPEEKMCRLLEVSTNAYRTWKRNRDKENTPSPRVKLLAQIKVIYDKSQGTYGAHRIALALDKQGVSRSKSYIARIMSEEGIRSTRIRKRKQTTIQNSNHLIRENRLNRDFKTSKVAQKWVSDITYIRLASSWIYLTTIIDLATREVVGWALSRDMTYENTIKKAWIMARAKFNLKPNFIFHSDRGSQYTCKEFELLVSNIKGASQSMSRKGNCWDNAVAESFFKTLKVECIYQHYFLSFKHAYNIIFDYIEHWYNRERIHTTNGNLSPVEMRKQLEQEQKKLAA